MAEQRGFKVAPKGDRELEGTREFDAPREMVWRAWTEPELLKRWLLGPDGWVLAVCEVDLRVGGKYRYVWRQVQGDVSMGMGGEFRAVEPIGRLVSTEKFDQAWYPGEMVATLELEDRGERTFMRQTFRYESREARDMVLKSPMEGGMAASYDRLEKVLGEERKGKRA